MKSYNYKKNMLSRNWICLNNIDHLIIEKAHIHGIIFNKVVFELNEETLFIGSYFTYGPNNEWAEYNSDYVVIFSEIFDKSSYDYKIVVKRLFDIKNRSFLNGTYDELMGIYNNSFKGISRKIA